MEQPPELTKALSELKRLTGLTMQITADTPEETATALEQIRCLCTAYREKYNKNDFLLSLMKNGIPAYDIYERAGRLHIPVEEKRVIYLLKTKELTDTIIEILRNLFSPAEQKPILFRSARIYFLSFTRSGQPLPKMRSEKPPISS